MLIAKQLDVMKNTRQGVQGPEGDEVPTLQQIMETMRAFQQANEKYRCEQERIREEARVEQERLRAEARADQDRLWEQIRLNQARLMEEIEASQGLWKNMHKPTRSCVKPMRNCEGTCTGIDDVLPENVPRTCP